MKERRERMDKLKLGGAPRRAAVGLGLLAVLVLAPGCTLSNLRTGTPTPAASPTTAATVGATPRATVPAPATPTRGALGGSPTARSGSPTTTGDSPTAPGGSPTTGGSPAARPTVTASG